MLSLNVIKLAQTEWVAALVFALKEDRSLCFCVACDSSNSLTRCFLFYIICMDECIDSIWEATVFSILDAYSGYWRVNIVEEDWTNLHSFCTKVYIALY